jgi:tRNA uridine 5-carboxymethylaminomethyl modification enzyme
MAGINVLRSLRGEAPFVLSRGEAYIGVLVDDLVYKGVEDPYRMFTSRAEHRLLLRQDNADRRLMRYGHELGLISNDDFARMVDRYERIESIRKKIYATGMRPLPEFDALLAEKGIPRTDQMFGKTVDSFLRRPEVQLEDVQVFVPEVMQLDEDHRRILEMEVKYEGYVKREMENIERREKARQIVIPADFDYDSLTAMKKEAREKLKRLRPVDLDAASRISGVDPPDIDLIHMRLLQLSGRNA